MFVSSVHRNKQTIKFNTIKKIESDFADYIVIVFSVSLYSHVASQPDFIACDRDRIFRKIKQKKTEQCALTFQSTIRQVRHVAYAKLVLRHVHHA